MSIAASSPSGTNAKDTSFFDVEMNEDDDEHRFIIPGFKDSVKDAQNNTACFNEPSPISAHEKFMKAPEKFDDEEMVGGMPANKGSFNLFEPHQMKVKQDSHPKKARPQNYQDVVRNRAYSLERVYGSGNFPESDNVVD